MRILSRSVFLVLLLTLFFSVPSFADGGNDPLSPAIRILQQDSVLNKTALCGEKITYSVKDFEGLLGIDKCGEVMITSLPPITHGKLLLGEKQVIRNQVISRREIGKLVFLPSSEEPCDCTFTFRTVGSEEYELTCAVWILKDMNYAPTVSTVDQSRTNVRTYENITGFFAMSAEDPENDRLHYEITQYPKKGILSVSDPASGSYSYTPVRNYIGKDRFSYVVRDSYGNCSEEKSVSIRIDENTSALVYSDLIGQSAQYSAIRLTEKQIVSPQYENGSAVFCPEQSVSRLDFLVMAMKATGHRVSTTVSSTDFGDDSEIPTALKGYVSAAVNLGYINGIKSGENLLFCPEREITRAEAAVILSRIVPLSQPVICPVFADQSSIPVWALDAVNALNRIGALTEGENGRLSPEAPLNRSECARMLCTLMEYTESK